MSDLIGNHIVGFPMRRLKCENCFLNLSCSLQVCVCVVVGGGGVVTVASPKATCMISIARIYTNNVYM